MRISDGSSDVCSSDLRIQQVSDVVARTPGLSFDAFPASQPRLAVRGIGSSDKGAAGDPSAAVFLDETYLGRPAAVAFDAFDVERIEVLKRSEEHTSELQSLMRISYAVFCLTKKKKKIQKI